MRVFAFCNVCAEVIKDSDKKHEKDDQKNFKMVKVSFKDMLAAHEKLARGEQVDQQVLSQLLLGGVINILAQHDEIINIEEKVKLLEQKQLTNQTRIESLENWASKQADQIVEVEQNVIKIDKKWSDREGKFRDHKS